MASPAVHGGQLHEPSLYPGRKHGIDRNHPLLTALAVHDQRWGVADTGQQVVPMYPADLSPPEASFTGEQRHQLFPRRCGL